MKPHSLSARLICATRFPLRMRQGTLEAEEEAET